MDKFIEVTLLNGDNLLVNTNYIITVVGTPNRTDGAKSKIITQEYGEVFVKEPYDRIKDLIAHIKKTLVE